MKAGRCPFRHGCSYAEACKDHSWLCIWGFWAAIAVSLGVVSWLVWRAL